MIFLQREDTEILLKKVLEIMNKLCCLKKTALLRQKTNLRPVMRNETRWSAFARIRRYFELKPHFDMDDIDLIQLYLSVGDEQCLKTLLDELAKFEPISKKLQEENSVDISDARAPFDELLKSYPELKYHLGLEDGNTISTDPMLEKSIAKALRKQFLTQDEELYLVKFKINPCEIEVDTSMTFADHVIERKRRKCDPGLLELGWIPSTSNIVERLLSRAGFLLTDYRKSLTPVNFESQMFLMANRNLWNELSVAKGFKNQKYLPILFFLYNNFFL